MMRYNRYHLALDVFGGLSALGVLVYIVLPDDHRLVANQDGMVANVLSEMVGIWVAVRLIDFFIRRSERHDRARVRVVRNMRMIERMTVNVFLFRNGFEVINLRRELRWVESISPQRHQFLEKDELDDVNAFYVLIREFCTFIPGFETTLDRNPFELTDLESMSDLIVRIEEARLRAEKNILAETEEDAGM